MLIKIVFAAEWKWLIVNDKKGEEYKNLFLDYFCYTRLFFCFLCHSLRMWAVHRNNHLFRNVAVTMTS